MTIKQTQEAIGGLSDCGHVSYWRNGQSEFLAENPELKALSARLTALEEALRDARDAISETLREDNWGGHELTKARKAELTDALSKLDAVLLEETK